METPSTADTKDTPGTCHKCKELIVEDQRFVIVYGVAFHHYCYNGYEHYYGLDKPID